MSFSVPSVISSAVKAGSPAKESWLCPAGIVADDTLFAWVKLNTAGVFLGITPPAGWTLEFDGVEESMFSKVADGTESGTTLTVLAQTTNFAYTSICFCVRDHHGEFVPSFNINAGSVVFGTPTVTFNSAVGNYQATINNLIVAENQKLLAVGAPSTADYNAFPATYTNPFGHRVDVESPATSPAYGTGYGWTVFNPGDVYIPETYTIGSDATGIDGKGRFLRLILTGRDLGGGSDHWGWAEASADSWFAN